MDTTTPVDPAFTKLLPKIELHAHLSGSISRQCLHDLWLQKRAADPTFDLLDPWVVMPPGKVDYTLDTFLKTFSAFTYQLLTDLPSIAYATTSVLSDFHADGIKYLELRTIPRSSPHFTQESYITTVLATITAFAERHPDLTTRLILSIDRGEHTPTDADAVVNLAIANKPLVVGVDIAGNPAKGHIATFGPALAKAKAAGLGVTVHFAEVRTPAVEGELETILGFGPDRLGHVIHVPELLRTEIVHRRVGLELCISCNVHAKLFDGGFLDHHFRDWWKVEECPVVLCTDDVGFFCSPVSNEYLLAAKHFYLTRTDVVDIARRAVSVIFAGEEEKKRLYRLLDEFVAGYSQ
ncbi:hypothetical protein BDV26DRAFT_257151 [Aspergillus bertholletiae]|uniref:Adenosine deaminase domain-containing protein n=1 Tax=Aspergillus bertholletiae TaxID=1226010 RepID=A0A5N7BFF5_9EURO|nr:hypothetical protein BDV26DRAFT_257151 [Aspergillus bertholletiae]